MKRHILELLPILIPSLSRPMLQFGLGRVGYLNREYVKKNPRWCTHLARNWHTEQEPNHRYLDVNAICKSLGKSLSNAIPAFHAFTGFDNPQLFQEKPKLVPILEQNIKFQEAFSYLGHNEIIKEDTTKIIEGYVCAMYEKKHVKTVNACRMDMFLKIYQPKKGKNPMANVKDIDGSFLPPCHSVLFERIKRTMVFVLFGKTEPFLILKSFYLAETGGS